MTHEHDNASKNLTRPPRTVRLPVFLSDEPVGIGDVIKRATSTIGIKPCGGCARRAAHLNSMMTFTGRRNER